MEQEYINMFKFSFPLIGGGGKKGDDFNIFSIVGTCFYIKNNFFITAGHVVDALLGYDRVAIGELGKMDNEPILLPTEIYELTEFKEFEIFRKVDLAILKIDINPKVNFFWTKLINYPPQTFETFGYPFALDIQTQNVYLRSITGNVVCIRGFSERVLNTQVYELSEICPRGISGAFLLNTKMHIIGMIIGNSSSEIEIYSEEVINEVDNTKIIDRKTEIMKYGIAITNSQIFEVNSKLLDMNFEEYLNKNNLIK